MLNSIKTKFDHIIIGQGLAGSCLALQLIKRGKKILVYDEPKKNRASAMAAGLVNPDHRQNVGNPHGLPTKSFPHLFRFYEEAEGLLKMKVLLPSPIYLAFLFLSEEQEMNGWLESEDPGAKKFINNIFTGECVWSSDTLTHLGG